LLVTRPPLTRSGASPSARLKLENCSAAIAANDLLCSRQSTYTPAETSLSLPCQRS
jgi:hypothetical protein